MEFYYIKPGTDTNSSISAFPSEGPFEPENDRTGIFRHIRNYIYRFPKSPPVEIPNQDVYYYRSKRKFHSYDMLHIPHGPINGLVLSERFYQLLEKFSVLEHTRIPIRVKFKKEEFQYNYILFHANIWNDINYKESQFTVIDRMSKEYINTIQITDLNDLIIKEKEVVYNGKRQRIGFNKLALPENLYSLDLIGILGISLAGQEVLISESLKREMDALKLTNCSTIPTLPGLIDRI